MDPRKSAPAEGRTQRARRLLRRTLAVACLLLAVAVAAPSVCLDVGRARARACVASISAPRGPELPDCERLSRWLALPLRVPWTARSAQILSEELAARMAVARYVDAAVGNPNRARLEERRVAVTDAADRLAAGTKVLRLSELGPTIPAPNLAELAFSVGDDEALDHFAFDWTQWYSSVHAIEAALLQGDRARASRLAEHYAGRPDTDLRVLVAAMLCAGDDPHRGLDEVVGVEQTRAAKRTANFWRNFGAARVVVEACAAEAGVAAPGVPPYGNAGEWDHRDRLLVLRARLARRAALASESERPTDPTCPDCGDFTGAAGGLVTRLASGLTTIYRAELVAALVLLEPEVAGLDSLARPRNGEPEPIARALLTVHRLVDRDGADQPFLTPDEMVVAARALLSRNEDEGPLRPTAGLLLARAAAAEAGLGHGDRALDWARQAKPLLFDEPAMAELFESSVAYIAGETALARSRIDLADEHASPASPLGAAVALQRAEIDASLGRIDDASREAQQAIDRAREARHGPLEERARWTAAALTALRTKQRTSPEDAPRTACAPAAASSSTSASWGRGPTPPCDRCPPEPVGTRAAGLAEETRARLVEGAVRTWRSWVCDGPDERRAHRYTAMAARGDAPEPPVAYLAMAGLLVDTPEQAEPWLDALFAIDARRWSLRAHAWARLEAARWRGDEEAARLWLERYRSLERLANDAQHGELLREARL